MRRPPAPAAGEVITQRTEGPDDLAADNYPWVHLGLPLLTWQGVNVTETATWLTLPDVAERLNLSIVKVHQLIKDGVLLSVRRDGVLRVPGELVANDTVLKHLPGVLT